VRSRFRCARSFLERAGSLQKLFGDKRGVRMRLTAWINQPVESLLDVGCNVGAWLSYCARLYPSARLAGVEIRQSALAVAKQTVPTAELHLVGPRRRRKNL